MDTKMPERYANMLPMAELDSAEKRLQPFPVLKQLRKTMPVRFDERRDCWDVFRFEDVQRILKDPKTFSSRRDLAGNGTATILTMDPPRHTQLRALVNRAFTPKVIADLAPHITSITHELLNSLKDGGKMELVNDLAVPLPVIVIAELLGVPVEDRKLFKEWSDILVKGTEENSDEAFVRLMAEKKQNLQELQTYFAGIVGQRRQNPKEDLISLLLSAEIEGERLNEAEILGFSILLLAAGNETTTNLITNAVRILTESSTIQQQVWENPDLIPSFIEETLRYYPPIQAIGRIAMTDVEVGGQRINKGDQVVSWVASANRDEVKFDSPDQFIPDRRPNAHLSFGFGIHFCLGAPLARLEAHISLQTLVKRMKNIRLSTGVPLTHIQSPFVFGVKQLPMTFEPVE